MIRLAALAALAAASILPAQIADLAVVHARIYTVNPEAPTASAIAVKDGKILAVADNVSRYIGKTTQTIDAAGSTLIPGLIDSHAHMRSLGESLDAVDLRGVVSEAQAVDKVRAAVKSHRPGEWIMGQSWDQNLWLAKVFPDAAALSAISPENPAYLSRVDGHAVWVNRRVLEIAGISAATPDPPGGRIVRDARGSATGIFIDRAMSLVATKLPKPSSAQIENWLERALRECARLGLTTVHDAGIGPEELEAYDSLIAAHRLAVRVYAMIAVPGATELWRAYRSRGPEIGDWLTVRSIKLIADGALGSRGAALLEPYSDDPGNRGLLILSGDFIGRIAAEAVASGFQVNTHAIGDRANRVALNAYAAALKGSNDHRFRIEHAQIVAPEDFSLFRQYSVLASMQPTHATSDMTWAESRIGPQRITGAYAWQTFLKLGVRVPGGSDFPVENPNPIWGFYSAVTRQDHEGKPPGGWFPEQRMTREQALKSWTFDGAYAAFQERTKGSLEPGKLADFVLLSDDIMKMPALQIWTAHVKKTVIDGRIAYSE